MVLGKEDGKPKQKSGLENPPGGKMEDRESKKVNQLHRITKKKTRSGWGGGGEQSRVGGVRVVLRYSGENRIARERNGGEKQPPEGTKRNSPGGLWGVKWDMMVSG